MTDHELAIKKFITIKLRRVSLQWPARNEAKRAAKIEYGLYRCASCKNAFGPKEIQMDHIKPVIAVKKEYATFAEWIVEFVMGLLTPMDNWQVLCKPCHDSKTLVENELRKINKKKNRKKRVQKRR